MTEVEQNLENWRSSLVKKIPVAGLLSRNPVAYKWKASYRVWMLRELALWRQQDLMTQSNALHLQGHGLGARILLRSGFEILATLTYLNLLMQQVLDNKLNFHVFAEKSAVLLFGSRNRSEMPEAINILTVLGKCEERYPGIRWIYGDLSESAHPNYEGLMGGYSTTNYQEYETTFSNRWMERHGDRQLARIMLCMEVFHHEYNDVWPDLMGKFEVWIEANDAELEATKNTPLT